MARPMTVLASTHNLSTDNLDTARWMGVDEGVTSPRVMAMLRRNQGHLLLCDGSAMQSRDSDLGVNGKVVEQHRNTSGGTYKGPASYQMFTCQPAGNAAPNNNATPPPVTLADLTGEWRDIAVSDDGTKVTATTGRYGHGAMFKVYHSSDSGATWTEGKEIPAYGWWNVACSSDGMKLVTIAWGLEALATSVDFGGSWRIIPHGTHGDVDSSADGTKLMWVGWNSVPEISTDSGATWSSRLFGADWQSVACSSDGMKWVATTTHGRIYTSTDGGLNWTPRETNRGWTDLASSKDGTRLVASSRSQTDGGYIYTSSDSGVTWMRQGTSGPKWYVGMSCSADGMKILVADADVDVIRISADAGVTWKATSTFPSEISCTSTSADGRKHVAGEHSGSIWYSADGGATWAKGKLRKP